jgi:hypothetical protein
VPRCAGQGQRHATPQGSERREEEERDEPTREEQALPEQSAQRRDDPPVPRRAFGPFGPFGPFVRGQHGQDEGREPEREHGDDDVGAPPAPHLGEPASEDSSAEDADDHARGHDPDVPATLARRGD